MVQKTRNLNAFIKWWIVASHRILWCPKQEYLTHRLSIRMATSENSRNSVHLERLVGLGRIKALISEPWAIIYWNGCLPGGVCTNAGTRRCWWKQTDACSCSRAFIKTDGKKSTKRVNVAVPSGATKAMGVMWVASGWGPWHGRQLDSAE